MGALLSPGTVAALARVAASAMPDTCTIQTRVSTPDGFGGATITHTDSAPTPCRVFQVAQAIQERGGEGRLESAVRWMVALPLTAAITAKDRLVCNGVTYEVAGVLFPSGYEVERQCQLEVLS